MVDLDLVRLGLAELDAHTAVRVVEGPRLYDAAARDPAQVKPLMSLSEARIRGTIPEGRHTPRAQAERSNNMALAFEDSNPERFQRFVQALMLLEYPHLQCFPVGQPDGGRDGLDEGSRTILQVKFKRSFDEDSVDWVLKTLKAELPKIKRLESLGMQNYVFATNAPGSSHPDTGRIDTIRDWFTTNL